eukprot:TRINITY_DN1167_c0_g1_i1.p1 TRINITY_DN1167_c0_g1~~TRINITY_DN1167_c0_g1_i1.p1  ORF type:complete len:368 (-),score=118.50 TRINITY_DN1167_c0_g1_i1:28-1131(-)
MLKNTKDKEKKEVDHIVSDFEENQHFSAANYPDWRELESLPAREDEYKKYNSKIPSRFATVIAFAGIITEKMHKECHPMAGCASKLQFLKNPGLFSITAKHISGMACAFIFFDNPSSADKSMIKQLQNMRNEGPNPNLFKKNMSKTKPPPGAHFFSFDPFFKRNAKPSPSVSPPHTLTFGNYPHEVKEETNEKSSFPIKQEAAEAGFLSNQLISPTPHSSTSTSSSKDFIFPQQQPPLFSQKISPNFLAENHLFQFGQANQMFQTNQMFQMNGILPFNQTNEEKVQSPLPSQSSPSEQTPKILGVGQTQDIGELSSYFYDIENDYSMFSPPRTRMRVECESDMSESEIQIQSELREVGISELMGWRL